MLGMVVTLGSRSVILEGYVPREFPKKMVLDSKTRDGPVLHFLHSSALSWFIAHCEFSEEGQLKALTREIACILILAVRFYRTSLAQQSSFLEKHVTVDKRITPRRAQVIANTHFRVAPKAWRDKRIQEKYSLDKLFLDLPNDPLKRLKERMSSINFLYELLSFHFSVLGSPCDTIRVFEMIAHKDCRNLAMVKKAKKEFLLHACANQLFKRVFDQEEDCVQYMKFVVSLSDLEASFFSYCGVYTTTQNLLRNKDCISNRIPLTTHELETLRPGKIHIATLDMNYIVVSNALAVAYAILCDKLQQRILIQVSHRNGTGIHAMDCPPKEVSSDVTVYKAHLMTPLRFVLTCRKMIQSTVSDTVPTLTLLGDFGMVCHHDSFFWNLLWRAAVGGGCRNITVSREHSVSGCLSEKTNLSIYNTLTLHMTTPAQPFRVLRQSGEGDADRTRSSAGFCAFDSGDFYHWQLCRLIEHLQ